MFTEKSRYRNAETYLMKDRRGRVVTVVSVPLAQPQAFLGFHKLLDGQRIDHLAARYTADDTGFWRIADANDAMLPESIAEKEIITIPVK